MTCRELIRLVTDYLEGALSESDGRRFETHLAGCEGCTAFLQQLRTTLRLVGRLGVESVPPAMERTLLHALREWKSA